MRKTAFYFIFSQDGYCLRIVTADSNNGSVNVHRLCACIYTIQQLRKLMICYSPKWLVNGQHCLHALLPDTKSNSCHRGLRRKGHAYKLPECKSFVPIFVDTVNLYTFTSLLCALFFNCFDNSWLYCSVNVGLHYRSINHVGAVVYKVVENNTIYIFRMNIPIHSKIHSKSLKIYAKIILKYTFVPLKLPVLSVYVLIRI